MGILVVTLDEKTTLLSLQQLFDLFNVPASDRILPVVVDDRYVKNEDNLIAVKEDIEYVKSDVHWHTKQKVLYIRSIRPLPTRSEQYRSIGK